MKGEKNMTNVYKPAKKLDEQIEYLNQNKRVQFNEMDKEISKNKLLQYNYINVISPFKRQFAKKDKKHEVVKIEGKHIYERDVEFKEYYECFVEERSKYPIIVKNILDFEIHFKSIMSYHILTNHKIENSVDLNDFLDELKLSCLTLSGAYTTRIDHMINHLDKLKKDVSKYADVYCFFDRMSLGNVLDVFVCLDNKLQDIILSDMIRFGMNFNTEKVPDFIKKVFCLVAIRNCVMHGNSLEILVRYYNHKTHELRKATDKKKYTSLIKRLSIEKTHE